MTNKPRRHVSEACEVLDCLGGREERFLDLERWSFDGDRARALRSLACMLADGSISLHIRGERVAPWRLDKWARDTELRDVEWDLSELVASLA